MPVGLEEWGFLVHEESETSGFPDFLVHATDAAIEARAVSICCLRASKRFEKVSSLPSVRSTSALNNHVFEALLPSCIMPVNAWIVYIG